MDTRGENFLAEMNEQLVKLRKSATFCNWFCDISYGRSFWNIMAFIWHAHSIYGGIHKWLHIFVPGKLRKPPTSVASHCSTHIFVFSPLSFSICLYLPHFLSWLIYPGHVPSFNIPIPGWFELWQNLNIWLFRLANESFPFGLINFPPKYQTPLSWFGTK